MDLEIVEANDSFTHVKLSGRMDIDGASQIEDVFTKHVAQRGKPAVVDMSEVSFLASMGLRTFLNNVKELSRYNAQMVFLKPQPMVQRILSAAGIGSLISCVKTMDEARKILDLP